jgi:hypothetical protein
MYPTVQLLRMKRYWSASEEMIWSVRRCNRPIDLLLEVEENEAFVRMADKAWS